MNQKSRNLLISSVLSIVILFGTHISFASENNLIDPMAKKCQPHTTYSDYVEKTVKKEQFSFIVEKSSVSQTIERSVTLTNSLSVKGSLSGELNAILAKSKINFELGYVGSKAVTTKITWGPIVNSRVRLSAGKLWAKTIGKKSVMDINCNLTQTNYSIEGTYGNYSDAKPLN